MLALLGLDSVSLQLVDELVEEGRMPAFAALRERGAFVPLATPGERLPAAAYPTVWTGVGVEDHGLYFPFLWSPEEQRVVVSGRVPSPATFWETIATAGGRVLVVDPYEARPPTRPVRAVVSGWQFRNRVVLESWSSPPELRRKWERRFGRGPNGEEVFGRPRERGLLSLRKALLLGAGRAATLVEGVLVEERPDVLVVDLPSTHIGGHQLWDPRAVLGSTALRPEVTQGLRDVYEAADAALGRIVAALPVDADVVVFSVLGMAANTTRTDLLPGMLSAVLAGSAPGTADAGGSAWRFRAAVPTELRAAVARTLPNRLAVELAARIELRGVDWSTTRAFCVPSDVQGFVRLNLRGRERHGIVAADDADALVDEIRSGLRTFADPDGRPIVAAVERLRDVLPTGPRTDRLPDLVVRWSDGLAISVDHVRSPTFGTVRRVGVGSGRSGNHTSEAWAVVVPGANRLSTMSRPAQIADIAATALVLQGLEHRGQPLLELR